MVALFRSLQGESLEDYAVRLAQAWRIGQRGLDNGVIFLVFLAERRLRLEVGYGLEAALTDAIAASIIRDVVAPRLREGRLAEGVEAGADAILAAIGGTYRAPARGRTPGRPSTDVGGLVAAGLVVLVVGAFLLHGLAQSRAARQRGWTGGRRGFGMGPEVGPFGGHWGGGGFSGVRFPGSGGTSGGGFRGGGGSFGGGGASGSW